MRRPIRFLLTAALALSAGTACTALLGVNDIFLDPNAPGAGEDAAREGSINPVEGGGSEGGTCAGDLQTDKKNCGRCGHDCLGGNCTGGKCEVVALAGALPAPKSLALDATYVYFANSGDGSVARVPKAGGKVETLVSAWQNVVGVAVSGTTLFWSSDGPLGDAGGGNFGGLWKCTLPACTDKKVISAVGDVLHLDVKGGYVYYANYEAVRRIKEDGTGDVVVATVNRPFSVVADATHVYCTSQQTSVLRSPITGGPGEAVGPLNGNVVGFMALDSTRFYWAYTDANSKGQVVSGLKAAPATRVTYGDANLGSVGVTADDTNVYWSNDGTATGIDSNGDGEVLTCPVAGCNGPPLRLADKLQFGGPLTTDATALYFLEFGGRSGDNGRVLKIAKP